MNSEELIYKGSNKLKKSKVKSHLIDSELILSSILKKNKESLIINSDYVVQSSTIKHFNNLI